MQLHERTAQICPAHNSRNLATGSEFFQDQGHVCGNVIRFSFSVTEYNAEWVLTSLVKMFSFQVHTDGLRSESFMSCCSYTEVMMTFDRSECDTMCLCSLLANSPFKCLDLLSPELLFVLLTVINHTETVT